MKLTRRDFVVLGLGLAATGCASSSQTVRQSSSGSSGWGQTGSPGFRQNTPTLPSSLNIVPRTEWAEADPIFSKIKPMNGVSRITVHHEGGSEVTFTDYDTMQGRMEQIRLSHLDRLSAADIGYHLVIDRAGQLWEGRNIQYQGAHVHPAVPKPDYEGPEAEFPDKKVSWNEHNLGVMVLGNFQKQSPSSAQLAALESTLAVLMKHYRVPVDRVFTHRELNDTECPGNRLQPAVEGFRTHSLRRLV